MKFGRNLSRNQVPEWASHYIDYKGLKKSIKQIVESKKLDGTTDAAAFIFALDRNLEDVDNFYNRKLADSSRRLKLLQAQYGYLADSVAEIDHDDIEDLKQALLEIRDAIRKIQWYGEVNRKGFIKITKKLDKKAGLDEQRKYIPAKVDTKSFARNKESAVMTKSTNDWLETLGAVEDKPYEQRSSSRSTNRSHGSPRGIYLPQPEFEALKTAIRTDDVAALSVVLKEHSLTNERKNEPGSQRLFTQLLQRAIAAKARSCVVELLNLVETLHDKDDINGRNCLHRYVISLHRAKGAEGADPGQTSVTAVLNSQYIDPGAPPILSVNGRSDKESLEDGAATPLLDRGAFLEFLVDNMSERHRPALFEKDANGRVPLHYAAFHGLVHAAKVLINTMIDWHQISPAQLVDDSALIDNEGWMPLHLAITGGHPVTTRAFLNEARGAALRLSSSRSREAFGLAVRATNLAVLTILISQNIDIDIQDKAGETLLHVAAQHGDLAAINTLLDTARDDGSKPNLEIAEYTFGWTPLFVAASNGHEDVVKSLVNHGAMIDKVDDSGWSPLEHASLRGHVLIARYLNSKVSQAPAPDSLAVDKQTRPLLERKISGNAPNSHGLNAGSAAPVRSFGHRYLTKQSMIVVNLGSRDMRKKLPCVSLDRIPFAQAHMTQLDTALSIIVSATGAEGEEAIVDLPIVDTSEIEPVVFMTSDASKVQLRFDVIPTYAGSSDNIVGRGVALLSSVSTSLGTSKMSLQGDVTVPIIAAKTLEVIGTINFNFLVITPFSHPNLAITEQRTYWKTVESTMVIGHRGLGKNTTTNKSLQLGENTIQSFITAANLGAEYVEFDVQITKDHVPIVYHDFVVSETGIDAPVHTLTVDQFLHINDGKPKQGTTVDDFDDSMNIPVNPAVQELQSRAKYRGRSQSVVQISSKQNSLPDALTERMKHTKAYREKGFKANTRGNFIQEPFTTLEEMFKRLPSEIGFNVEMKYPMLHETEELDIDNYAIELNFFVDTVLKKVYDLCEKRNVIFSSFNPDICLLLSFKQPSIPVLFLTDSGMSPVGDVRASSLQEAIRFASRWNLLGIVTVADPLVLSPRLVKVVKEHGLVCVSYGSVNNDPELVQRQVQEGIDAVIVDSVLKIRKGLREHESNGNKTTIPSHPAEPPLSNTNERKVQAVN